MDRVRENSISIIRFLQDFTRLRSVSKRDIRDFEDHLWFHDVPAEPGCYSRAWAGSDDQPADLWLQVKKPTEPRIPSPPQTLADWVDPESLCNSSGQPKLRDRILRQRAPLPGETEPPPPEELRLASFPELTALWDEYVAKRWIPWSDFHKRWQVVHEAYAKLFSMHQLQVKLGEEFELLVGVGCLVWRTPKNQVVRRHLLVSKAVLHFDASRGVFSVTAPADGAKLQLELDMLEADDAPSLDEKRQVDDLLAKCENDPWDRSLIEPVLRAVAHSIEDSGVYDDNRVPATSADNRPQVSFAPALILRKRSTRGFLAVLQTILTQLEGGAPVPTGMAQMAGGDSNKFEGESADAGGTSCSSAVYFPLPANKDQLQIVRKLRGQSGIHVQGPPGTGKSHTIANLICHLLASGKRVLITAQTPRALKVLHEKIPKEMQPLCVSLLGNDKASFDQLERCVREVVARFDSWHQSAYEDRIHQSEAELQSLQTSLVEFKTKLRALRERETLEHQVAGGKYRGTAASIASLVHAESPAFGWFTDAVDPQREPPLSSSEAVDLLNYFRVLASASSDDLTRLICPTESVRGLADSLVPLFAAEREAAENLRVHTGHGDAAITERAAALSAALLAALLDSLGTFDKHLAQALARRQPWIPQAIQDVLGDNDTPWRTLQETIGSSVAALLTAAKKREAVRLVFPDNLDRVKACADAEDLKKYLDAGGSLGLLSTFNAVVKRTKYLRQTVLVDGRAADSPATLQVLIDCFKTERAIDDAWRHWTEHAERPGGSLLRQASVLAEHVESLNTILQLRADQSFVRTQLSLATGVPEPVWHDAESVQRLAAALRHADAVRRKTEAERAIQRKLASLQDAVAKPNAHDVLQRLLTALTARDRATALKCVGDIGRIEQLRLIRRNKDELVSRLRLHAPELLARLAADQHSPEWESVLPHFEAAWHHARAAAWLDSTFGDADEQECEAQIHRIVERIGQTTARLAADLGWMKCLSRMSEEHRRHFVAWGHAMKSLGKGTGKYAEKHRHEAQLHLAKCRDAIPAWIMPLHYVYDSVEPSPEVFDVIIVDEASQCGLDSRVLAYLTKQLVVVGDDKQISPEAVGVDRAEVFQLIQQHLGNLPHSQSFQPERSLFDFADLWFGDRIVLQEHFRCVPEIIRFSSDLCYKVKPLVPLRQYPPDRLKPVVARKIAGLRSGSGSNVVNRAEADAVVQAIVACNNDPRYKGKEFGVISLQGDSQAKLIEKLLLDALAPRDIEQRRLVCGDAYSFQGDERHVMFLSMVAAPNETIGPFTKEADVRRFNVAMSRAQDQVWLFHSVDASDLNRECCRRRLLDYCYQPTEQAFRGLPIHSWRELARAKTRSIGQQPSPFESWFELDVFLALLDKGYRVLPQFEIAASRIDLMVEGLRARLAVECNGEHWHGPDRWEHDQDRQRRLERAGLRFFTVWESAFRRDPSETLEPLWHELEKMGISPLGTGESLVLDRDGYVPSATGYDRDSQAAPQTSEAAAEELVKDQSDQIPPIPQAIDEVSEPNDAPSTDWSLRQPPNVQQSILFPPNSDVAAPLPSVVEQYQPWLQQQPFSDPRTAPIKELVEGLRAIIAAEGPVLCLRSYQLYSRAAGLMKLHSATRGRFNQAIQRGVDSGLFELSDGYGAQYQMNRFVRLKGSPPVRVRTLGTRTIHEVAPDELAAFMSMLAAKDGPQNREDLFRRVLNAYGLVRSTEQTTATLEEARKRAKPPLDVV